jgi:hypothetical protein
MIYFLGIIPGSLNWVKDKKKIVLINSRIGGIAKAGDNSVLNVGTIIIKNGHVHPLIVNQVHMLRH